MHKKKYKKHKKHKKKVQKAQKAQKKVQKAQKKVQKAQKNVFFIIYDLIIFSQSLYKKLVKPFIKYVISKK